MLRQQKCTMGMFLAIFVLSGSMAHAQDVFSAACSQGWKLEIMNRNTAVCVVRGLRHEMRSKPYNPCPAPGGAITEGSSGVDRCRVFGRTLAAAPCPSGSDRKIRRDKIDLCQKMEMYPGIIRASDAQLLKYLNSNNLSTSPGGPGTQPSLSTRQTLALQCLGRANMSKTATGTQCVRNGVRYSVEWTTYQWKSGTSIDR